MARRTARAALDTPRFADDAKDGPPRFVVKVQPRAVRYWWMRSGVRAEWVGVSSRVVPRWRWTCWTESWMGGRLAVRAAISGMRTSMRSPSAWPPCWRMSFETRALAMGAALKSAPRSKRWEASVWRPWRREERRTVAGSNQAASTRMFFVSAVIMESQPPMTPARAEGLFVVGYYEVVGFEDALGAVEEFELFAFAGEADDDAAFELVEVEGVGGMAHAEEDEVAGVDGVGDLFLAEEIEVFGDLAGAGGDGDVAEDLGGEAAAEVLVGFDGDGVGGRLGSSWPRTKCGVLRFGSE